MTTIRWLINERDIEKRRREVEMDRLYRDAYLYWEKHYDDAYDSITYSRAMEWGEKFEGMKQTKFGTAPVKDAYWGWDGKIVYKKSESFYIDPTVQKYFDSILLNPKPVNMEFDSNRVLTTPFYDMDTLLKSFLGILEPMGYKFGNSKGFILDDSWTVNLVSTQPEGDVMMREFLKGFGCQNEKVKNQWEEKHMSGIDVSEELKDLYKVYSDAHTHLESKEKDQLCNLVGNMKKFIEVYEERKKVASKLSNLKGKLTSACSECEDEGDDE